MRVAPLRDHLLLLILVCITYLNLFMGDLHGLADMGQRLHCIVALIHRVAAIAMAKMPAEWTVVICSDAGLIS